MPHRELLCITGFLLGEVAFLSFHFASIGISWVDCSLCSVPRPAILLSHLWRGKAFVCALPLNRGLPAVLNWTRDLSHDSYLPLYLTLWISADSALSGVVPPLCWKPFPSEGFVFYWHPPLIWSYFIIFFSLYSMSFVVLIKAIS